MSQQCSWLLACVLSAVFAGVLPARARAQSAPVYSDTTTPRRRCDGDTITAIDIHAHPAGSVGGKDNVWRTRYSHIASQFAVTTPGVIRSYIRLEIGDRCTELHRSESERLLRAQPFIALASVRAVPDGRGHARILVDVVDEFPLLVNGGLSRGQISYVGLGTQNLRGRGTSILVNGTRGFAYRNGYGAQVAQYGAFGQPYYIAGAAAQHPLGEALSSEFAYPFFSELQRHAFDIGVKEGSEYFAVNRPDDDAIALYNRRLAYDLAFVRRLGTLDRRHTIGFAGVALLGEDVRINNSARIISDSGLVAVPDGTFAKVYPKFAATRIAGIGGLRALRFLTVRGFDALDAEQDMGVGVQLNVLDAPSVWEAPHPRDMFLASDLYAGAGTPESFFAAHFIGEGRRNDSNGNWDGVAVSSQMVWYGKSSLASTHIATLSMAAIRSLDYPAQLTFGDQVGGLMGYPNSDAAGGGRAVLRLEERRIIDRFTERVDWAVAGFVDAGKLWAGDAPFGTTTGVRASAGISILIAYPAGSKRTIRADLAVPFNAERGAARYELRLTWLDRTQMFWHEPHDVARVRSGAMPANLMTW